MCLYGSPWWYVECGGVYGVGLGIEISAELIKCERKSLAELDVRARRRSR